MKTLYIATPTFEEIPHVLGSVSTLEAITIVGGTSHGAIPESWKWLKCLKVLALRDNQLEGALPSWIGDLSRLERIDLGGNKFSGTLPQDWSGVTEITEMRFELNRLTGMIPDQFATLPKLTELFVCGNYLSGDIPPEFMHRFQRIKVNIANNSFRIANNQAVHDWLHSITPSNTKQPPEHIERLNRLTATGQLHLLDALDWRE